MCLVLGDQLQQVAPAVRPVWRQLAGGEGVAELLVQTTRSVTMDDTRLRMSGSSAPWPTSPSSHLARSLRVPDDAAQAPPQLSRCLTRSSTRWTAKNCWITGDLANTTVKHRETKRQVEQALRAAQGVEHAILLGDSPRLVHFRFAQGLAIPNQIEQARLPRGAGAGRVRLAIPLLECLRATRPRTSPACPSRHSAPRSCWWPEATACR